MAGMVRYAVDPDPVNDEEYQLARGDATGRAEVNVIAAALPAGAATLAEQQTQTTALQLIDNLIALLNALATVATDQLRVDVIAELPAGTQNIGNNWPAPLGQLAADINAPAANTAAVVTYVADATHQHQIGGVVWSYTGGIPTGGSLIITDAGAIVFSIDIPDEGVGPITFPSPIIAALVNTAMVVTLAAGGAGITGKANVFGHRLV
ncbi:hypothetical protein KKE60_06390 [Patescibacteria group bacterium]|nr:hypothetical protein [Patescibacteria group bacterium]